MDIQHNHFNYAPAEIEHLYGDNVHIFADPFDISILAKLCRKGTVQPLVNSYVDLLYSGMLRKVVGSVFPRMKEKLPTRMIDITHKGYFHGEVVDPTTPVVSVNLARAGTFPSHLTYNFLNYLMDPSQVRQDHFICNRRVDDEGKVVGVDISGSKIGGDIDKALVLFPDPMGATGSTICSAIEHYKNNVEGNPLKFVSMHLIITPEYIKTINAKFPDVEIFAIRLDRGLSDDKILKTVPGTHIDQEKGLTDLHYIVPGAGGLGEVLNNSFI